MKRKITIILLLMLLISLMATTVFAAGSASLAISNGTVYRGGTLTVVAKISGVGTCKAGSAEVSYGSGLTWESVTCSNSNVTINAKIDKGQIIFYSMSGTNIDGDLLVLTFKVKDNAGFVDNKIDVRFDINGQKLTASATVNVSCYHQFNEWANYSATSHIRRCGVCGKEEVAEHSYDNDCDTTCNGCGVERTITHKFSEVWTGDESGHWHACDVCGEKDATAAHVPGEAAGEYTDQICTVCKYVLVEALGHTHRYDETYSHDASGHWQVCTGCQEATEAVEHGFDGDCDETCDECGYQRQITHALGRWEFSDDSHWKVCSNCNQKLEEAAHIWDAGYVQSQATTTQTGLIIHHCTECMAERQKVTAQALPTDPAGGWQWWIWMSIGAGGGVIVTAAIFTLIIILGVKKKSRGRYSN